MRPAEADDIANQTDPQGTSVWRPEPRPQTELIRVKGRRAEQRILWLLEICHAPYLIYA